MREAAELFALRAARREFGRGRARVGALRMDSYRIDGKMEEFEAFIGYATGLHEVSGHNIRFCVYEY